MIKVGIDVIIDVSYLYYTHTKARENALYNDGSRSNILTVFHSEIKYSLCHLRTLA